MVCVTCETLLRKESNLSNTNVKCNRFSKSSISTSNEHQMILYWNLVWKNQMLQSVPKLSGKFMLLIKWKNENNWFKLAIKLWQQLIKINSTVKCSLISSKLPNTKKNSLKSMVGEYSMLMALLQKFLDLLEQIMLVNNQIFVEISKKNLNLMKRFTSKLWRIASQKQVNGKILTSLLQWKNLHALQLLLEKFVSDLRNVSLQKVLSLKYLMLMIRYHY